MPITTRHLPTAPPNPVPPTRPESECQRAWGSRDARLSLWGLCRRLDRGAQSPVVCRRGAQTAPRPPGCTPGPAEAEAAQPFGAAPGSHPVASPPQEHHECT